MSYLQLICNLEPGAYQLHAVTGATLKRTTETKRNVERIEMGKVRTACCWSLLHCVVRMNEQEFSKTAAVR